MIPNKISTTPATSGVNQTNQSGTSAKNAPVSNDDAFKKLLDQSTANAQSSAPTPLEKAPLPTEAGRVAADQLKFSAHAVDRMKSRGISFAPAELKQIEDAIAKASEKGAKDTLVLSGDSALIVSVKNNTVVTVMDKGLMKDNVFTNIDSTVVL